MDGNTEKYIELFKIAQNLIDGTDIQCPHTLLSTNWSVIMCGRILEESLLCFLSQLLRKGDYSSPSALRDHREIQTN